MSDEKYIFKGKTKKMLLIVGAVGLLLVALGLWTISSSGGHAEEETHALTSIGSDLVASADSGIVAVSEEAEEGHASPIWKKRLFANLWMNNVFFTGLAVIGLCFVAIQYAASAGWSAPIKRIPLAMASWLPIAAVLMIVVYFLGSHDIFHWTHADLYGEGGDEILKGKQSYFFWPLDGLSGTPVFYIARMVIFFGLWYIFFIWIKKGMLAEDLDPSTKHWFKLRKLSAIFLIIFAYSSSVAAWDWVMSIDPHWFSTMFGWYVFASWWVTGLAVITFTVAKLKDQGYLSMVNASHLHDLGKFVFAFTIFWTYIWFGQYMLIYYANIPEETVYFVQRLTTSPYNWIFFVNLIVGFVLPFLLFMTRDSKRHTAMLLMVCPVVVVGHWFDFYLMINPGIMQNDGGIGLLEIGMTLVYGSAFIFVMLSSLAKVRLVAKNHPMMAESLHHHI